MKDNLTVYKTVFDRVNPTHCNFKQFIYTPAELCEKLGMHDPYKVYRQIKATTDKAERNHFKRNYLPAVDLSPANIFSIDIDDISHNIDLVRSIAEKLTSDRQCLAVTESISGNLVAYYKFNCDKEEFNRLYYKKYLELTLSVGVNIDFLPEINRLRYLSVGARIWHYNEESETVTEMFQSNAVPYISHKAPAEAKKGKRVIFKSL